MWAEGRKITLQLDAPVNPPWVHVDPERIRQVLTNLLSNALRYTPPGGTVRQEDLDHLSHRDPAHPLHEDEGPRDGVDGPVFARDEVYRSLPPSVSIRAISASTVSRNPSSGSSFIRSSSSRKGRARTRSTGTLRARRSLQRA